MNRRAFIQGLIGLASMPAIGKYINIFKPAAVREGITQAADTTMSKGIEFYEAVIKRVMDEGTITGEADRFRTYKHPDKPDISVELNVGTGDTAVYFDTDMGSRAGAEITTDIEMPRAGKELMENEEVYRMGGDNYYKDIDEEITGGIGSLEEWIKMKRGYAAGGRVGLVKGGMPRGLMAALRSIRSKFGDDAIKTADEMKPDYDYYREILDDAENTVVQGDETINELEALVKQAEDYEAAMFAEYKSMGGSKRSGGPKDPLKDAIENASPGYTGDLKYDAQILADDLAEQRFGKEFDDLTQQQQSALYDEAYRALSENQATFIQNKNLSKPTKTLAGIKNTGTINISDPNVAEEFSRFMKESDPTGFKDLEQKVELSNFNPKGRKKNAQGGIIGLTNNPMTASNKAGVETLFERR